MVNTKATGSYANGSAQKSKNKEKNMTGQIENMRRDEYVALNHLRSCMEYFNFDSEEYRISQRSSAWIANKIFAREKMNRELWAKHLRLCEK